MSRGIAAEFARRYPLQLEKQTLTVGDCIFGKDQGKYIFHMITKPVYNGRPTYKSIENSLNSLLVLCNRFQVNKLAMPKIACGLDKLEWTKVSVIIKQVFSKSNIQVTIYDRCSSAMKAEKSKVHQIQVLEKMYNSCLYEDQKEIISCLRTRIFSRDVIELCELNGLGPDYIESYDFVNPEVFVNGKKIAVLNDSGASHTFTSMRFLNTEPVRSLELKIKPLDHECVLADNHRQKLTGIVAIPIVMQNKHLTATALITDPLSYDLILGRDWMEMNGVILDFVNKRLLLTKGKVTNEHELYILATPSSPAPAVALRYAKLQHTIKLDPFVETKVFVQSEHAENETVFAKGYDPLYQRLKVNTVQGLCTFKNKQTFLMITNFGKKSITLPAGTIVAELEVLSENEYSVEACDVEEDELGRNKLPELKILCAPLTIDEQLCNWKSPKKPEYYICKTDDVLVRIAKIGKSSIEWSKPNSVHGSIQLNQSDHAGSSPENSKLFKSNEQNGNEINQKEKEALRVKYDSFLKDLNIDRSLLTAEQLEQVYDLFLEKIDAFHSNDQPPSGNATQVTHRINTGEALPIHQPKYRAAHHHKKSISEQTAEMLKKKIISPSRSPWSSPVVLVKKKDGTMRFCVDYRKLNAVTIKDKYPLPRIDDALAMLRGNMWFSGMDVATGYWQIPVHPDDRAKTAFITDDGLFEFNVMSFGLTNGPATFQRYIDAAMSGLKWNCLLVYIDDIIVFSGTFEEHLEALREVLDRLIVAGLPLKASKCHFFQSKLSYLGHIITPQGIEMDPVKVKAIVNMPTPNNSGHVRSFLGMCNWYRMFVEKFA